MPLTALGPDGERIIGPFCTDAAWGAVHKTRPRASLTCRDCGASMHAKVSGAGLRFFAHDRAAECQTTGESVEHMALKVTLAELVASFGLVAELEAAGDGWRADVLVALEDGRRVALEVQLSSMSYLEGTQRTERYRSAGVEVVWFYDVARSWTPPQWADTIPSAGLRGLHPYTGDGLTIEASCAKADVNARGWWADPGPVPLARFLASLLTGRLVYAEIGGRRRRAWVKPVDLDWHHAFAATAMSYELTDRARYGELALAQDALRATVAASLGHRPGTPWVWLRNRDPELACYGLTIASGTKSSHQRLAVIEPTVIAANSAHLPIWATSATAALLRERYGPRVTVHVVDLPSSTE